MSLLEVRSATKAFGSLVAVADVSLTVGAGELRAIIGPNGAGKTTFFNLITGFFPPTSGTIRLEGRDITRSSAVERVRMGMGRTFQVTEIFPELTVRENIQIAVEVATGFRIRPWLRRTEAKRVQDRVDEILTDTSLSSQADRLVGELSHGDQRSAEIAMALALRPRLLLLDEPSLGLAPLVVREIFRIVRTINRDRGVSVLLVEQNAAMALALADHAYLMETGRMVQSGPAAQLKQDDAIRRAYLGY
jgi:branched-chain amino acid transport system ATP-binding protein